MDEFKAFLASPEGLAYFKALLGDLVNEAVSDISRAVKGAGDDVVDAALMRHGLIPDPNKTSGGWPVDINGDIMKPDHITRGVGESDSAFSARVAKAREAWEKRVARARDEARD